MKKILINLFAVILAVSMVFTMAPLSMGQAYAVTNPITVDGVVYTPNEDGTTATVNGVVDTTQSTVTIPSNFFDDNGFYTVTSIGEYAFQNCTNLTTITIPESVTIIGQGAFEEVPLTTVNFGGTKAQWDAITGEDKPTDVTVNFAKEDPLEDPISIEGAGVSQSTTVFTYNGAVQRSVITMVDGWKLTEGTDYTAVWADSKNVGEYTVYLTGKGKYKGTAKATYRIVPKGTTLKKPKKAKKAVTVKWKKQSEKMSVARITGYQIQLATNKDFTKNTKTVNVKGYKKTSKKVKRLKGKTKYYIHIRTLMNTGGSTFCSPWSKTKTVKTK